MDKQTLSNYGWIVIVTLILAVMLALATPFGNYAGDAVVNVANGLVGTSSAAINEDNINTNQEKWNSKFDYSSIENNSTSTPNIDLSDVDPIMSNNSWATIQKVIQANKTYEAGWRIGDTIQININQTTKIAKLIGINHDGNNTATFIISSSNGLGSYTMNDTATNSGGWEASRMREWLNTEVFESMVDVKEYIKPVKKLTNNVGYTNNTVSETEDKLFLLSVKESGLGWLTKDDYKHLEGKTYEWFADGNSIGNTYWCRTLTSYYSQFCKYNYAGGYNLSSIAANVKNPIYPAFVIG